MVEDARVREEYDQERTEKPTDIDKKRINEEELRLLKSKRATELDENCFTKFYHPNFPVQYRDLEGLSSVERALKQYEHEDAVNFMTASWMWMNKDPPTVALPRSKISVGLMPTHSMETSCRALYQVIAEMNDKYILMACHMNVHGEHRGDLRFVEVNGKSVAKGCNDSMIGNLLLGDIVAVTELARTQREFVAKTVYDVTADEECMWMVREMTILPRKLVPNVKFAVLENGMVVVKGYGETMKLAESDSYEMKEHEVYSGDLFVPVKIICPFAEDHHSSQTPQIISRSSNIPPYPPPTGTIYKFQTSSMHTRMFEIGTDAFRKKYAVEGDDILEFCALIGYAATNSTFFIHNDYRKFMMLEPKRDGFLVRFAIDNPESYPTEGLWHTSGRLLMIGPHISAHAMVETIICEDSKLKFVARFARDTPSSFDFQNGIYTVQQRQPPEAPLIQDGFFKHLYPASNGRQIIQTLYGGPPMEWNEKVPSKQYIFPSADPIHLNEFQCEYVTRILNGAPIILGNSPFGCGKSMTIVTAALYMYEQNKRNGGMKQLQLLLTQSNYASVNLIDIARKTTGKMKEVKFLRYVSEMNWKEMPDACRTEVDVPELMDGVFKKWATEKGPSSFPELTKAAMMRIVGYLRQTGKVNPFYMNSRAMSVYNLAKPKKAWPNQMVKDFIALYEPDIIVVTANSLNGLSKKLPLSTISLVQIDEASQLPEYTLFNVLHLLPEARFGLIGDIHQLPPYCEEELTGRLKDYGVGNAMERAAKQNMFPQAILREVYRCHPVTTQLLGEMFYENMLISRIPEEDRNEFMTRRPHFWPNNRFPMLVVDNKVMAKPMGTSYANEAEIEIVKKIIDFIISKDNNGYAVDPEDIGVISYFSAQTSLLTDVFREKSIKCGTVDSFQGSEKEVVILCCTNGDIKGFMTLKNRLNVAMSRAKQVTIIIGNVEMLKKVEHWSTIIDRAEQNGCVVNEKNLIKKEPSGEPMPQNSGHDVVRMTEEMGNLLHEVD